MERLQVLVEFVYERYGRGDVVSEDFCAAHATDLLDDGTQGIPVRDDDQVLAVLHLGADRVVPVGQHAIEGSLKRLGPREAVRWEQLISPIVAWVALHVIKLYIWRGNIVAPAPDVDLVEAVLLRGLRLVESLESAVVALVKSPRLVEGDPELVHLISHSVKGLD